MVPSFRFLPVAVVFGALWIGLSAATAADMSVVERWMNTNSGVGSIKISFSQTRKMKSLQVPITQQGTLWVDYGRSRFRWEAGRPAKTIVVRKGSQMTIMRTPMKKYEKRPFSAGSADAPGMSALAGGFPRSMAEFNRKYRVKDIAKRDNTWRIQTQPLGSAGRGVSSLTFVIQSSGYKLVGIEIALSDGSSVRTVFNRVQTNVAMPSSLFSPDLSGYKETKF